MIRTEFNVVFLCLEKIRGGADGRLFSPQQSARLS